MTALIMLAICVALIAKGCMKIHNTIRNIDPTKFDKVAGDARQGYTRVKTALKNIQK